MVDAPWLSPGEHSGAFFIFGVFGHLSVGAGFVKYSVMKDVS